MVPHCLGRLMNGFQKWMCFVYYSFQPDTKPILRGIINVKKDSASYGKHKFFSVSRDSGIDFGIAIAGGRESVSYKV